VSKHTPGPWHYFETEDGRCRVKPLNGKYIVAECSAMEPQCEEQRSNARLMTAAPELLEALKMGYADTMDYIQRNHLSGGENNLWLVLARAAIAKAEGAPE